MTYMTIADVARERVELKTNRARDIERRLDMLNKQIGVTLDSLGLMLAQKSDFEKRLRTLENQSTDRAAPETVAS